ncbi:hypothetical protein [Vibrio penaeicida]|nr:hypothetical protein [Vibrio penaeicida]RTZ24895.1 hypothetical protein EKN09_01095 [Vibrio penaeicida]
MRTIRSPHNMTRRFKAVLLRMIGFRFRQKLSWALIAASVLVLLSSRCFMLISDDYEIAESVSKIKSHTSTAWISVEVRNRNENSYDLLATLTPKSDALELYGYSKGKVNSDLKYPYYELSLMQKRLDDLPIIQEEIKAWELSIIQDSDRTINPSFKPVADIQLALFDKQLSNFIVHSVIEKLGFIAMFSISLFCLFRRMMKYEPVVLHFPIFLGSLLVSLLPIMKYL